MSVFARARRIVAVLGAFLLVVTAQGIAFADGTETLGPPSIPIATGSGTVAAGVGLHGVTSGTINVTVPGTPVQALLYWEVQRRDAIPGSETITVNASSVTGTAIGGPTTFFTGYDSVVYRADVTGLVTSGANALGVTLPPEVTAPLSQARINDGAGIMVIYDDGSVSEIGIRDGDDVSWFGAPDAARQTTVPQTFTFAAESAARTGSLTLFVSSVADDTANMTPIRPTAIDVSSGVVTVTYDNVLDSNDGDYWDTYVTPVAIPAGATSVTVQVQSEDNVPIGANPASLVWIGASLTAPVTPPPPGGGEGCTPGYWKQSHHFDSWPAGYSTTDGYEATFGVDASFSKDLLGALKQGGGGEKALGRHATAALLNSANADVSYEYSTADVISLVQSAYASGDFEGVKNLLEAQNEMGCPLN